MNIAQVFSDDSLYPPALKQALGESAPATLYALGNLELLRVPSLALFCSNKCPGNLILQTYDMAIALRDANIPTISGFHTPMERECWTLLLRGKQPIIYCLARGISPRLSSGVREPLKAERLLLLSPFNSKTNRITSETSTVRNRVVAALASAVLVVYAAPKSKTEQLCGDLLAQRKTVYTIEDSANANILQMGAIGLRNDLVERIRVNNG